MSGVSIADNTISGNSAGTFAGAGIYCYSSSPEIRNNTIESNTVTTALGEGGGIFCNNKWYEEVGDGCNPLISGNRFIDNDGKDHGGAIALENEDTKPVIVNNLFVGNHAAGWGGGAINALEATPSIVNNTFVGNSATAGNGNPGYGGAIIVRGAGNTTTMINNIFSNNTAVEGNSVACDSTDASPTILFCDAYPDVPNAYSYHYKYCPELGQNCKYIDPLFVDPSAGNYHLQIPTSGDTPIDHGHDLGTSPYDKVPAVDLDEYARPVDVPGVTNGTGGATDMGAYEAH